MDLEEKSLDPVIERTCEVCGAKLTEQEIRAAFEAKQRYLCSVHAAELEPAEDQAELDEPV
jgi:CRISPR/Cas system-associated protein Cas10 (large subunit of type III CRISPR-Cas system)